MQEFQRYLNQVNPQNMSNPGLQNQLNPSQFNSGSMFQQYPNAAHGIRDREMYSKI